ncbi:hypothetical protein PQQ87_08765 [Paraburkholderia nemoris]|uniref:hypothetical protein n=1 Tax=Paraburkholderia nemoris TaxID=2793076 RepID=UPI0038B71F20
MGETKDLELMKMLAKTVAEETVREMLDQVRGEISEQIDRQFKTYFGDMTATQHAVDHSRLSKVLDRMDKTVDGLWSKVIDTFWKIAAGVVIAGYMFGGKLPH